MARESKLRGKRRRKRVSARRWGKVQEGRGWDQQGARGTDCGPGTSRWHLWGIRDALGDSLGREKWINQNAERKKWTKKKRERRQKWQTDRSSRGESNCRNKAGERYWCLRGKAPTFDGVRYALLLAIISYFLFSSFLISTLYSTSILLDSFTMSTYITLMLSDNAGANTKKRSIHGRSIDTVTDDKRIMAGSTAAMTNQFVATRLYRFQTAQLCPNWGCICTGIKNTCCMCCDVTWLSCLGIDLYAFVLGYQVKEDEYGVVRDG